MSQVFQTLDKIKPAYDAAFKVTMFLCKLLLIADVAITCMAVLGRYVSFIPDPSWSEEIVLTCMVYMTLISASMALRRNAHIRMTAFDSYLPKKLLKVSDLIADVAVLAFAVIMIVFGTKYAFTIGAKGNYTSLPWLSKFWLFISVAIGGVFSLIFELEAVYNHIKSLCGYEDEKKEAVSK